MNTLKQIRAQTIDVYERHACGWDQHRPRVFFEKNWLDRFIIQLPENGHVLDLGCGAGEPISAYLIEQGFHVTGIDTSPSMLALSRSRFPNANWLEMDMRQLKLDTHFDGILSWDGFFHLSQTEQCQALLEFSNHLNPNGSLLLTIGPESGEVTGTVEGEKVYHSSLSSSEYQQILTSVGFDFVDIALEDESCGFHSVLLAKKCRANVQNVK